MVEFPLIQKTQLLLGSGVEQEHSAALFLYCFFPETSSVLSPFQVMAVTSERM